MLNFLVAYCLIWVVPIIALWIIGFSIYIFWQGIFTAKEKFENKGYNKKIMGFFPLFCCATLVLSFYFLYSYIH